LELKAIYKSVKGDLAKVESQIKAVTEVECSGLAELLKHILLGGKAIRPALTFLSARFYNYDLDLLLPMATSVELMHTSTLVHDDAIDNSAVRRGRPTVNSLWGVDRAVLLGDYLFAKAGEFAALTGNLRVIRLFAQTLQIISSGELRQTFDAFNLEQGRQQYFERITAKTASLFSLSTQSGAILSQAPEESIRALEDYGTNLGIAFQVVDDLLDFTGTEGELGKPVGSDLAQGTLTLPAMLLLERYPEDNPVRELFDNPDMPEAARQEKIKRAIDMIGGSSIERECYKVASDYCDKARRQMESLPAGPARQTLAEIADFVVSRKS
jgi:heptaprenyl diphosphate synthase/octaprenyl-diphosphate synthase